MSKKEVSKKVAENDLSPEGMESPVHSEKHKDGYPSRFSGPKLEPLVRIEGHVNPFISHLEAHPDLEFKALGVARIPGTNNYVSFTLDLKGLQVQKMIVDEPNMKAIAVDAAKILFVTQCMDQE